KSIRAMPAAMFILRRRSGHFILSSRTSVAADEHAAWHFPSPPTHAPGIHEGRLAHLVAAGGIRFQLLFSPAGRRAPALRTPQRLGHAGPDRTEPTVQKGRRRGRRA